MKIHYWTPHMDKVGTIKATINSALILKQRGHDVKIYKTYHEWEGYEKVLEENQIDIIDFGLGKKFHNLPADGIGYRFSMILISIFSYGKLIKNFEEDKPDVVICNLLGYLPILARERAKYKPKIVSSIQGKPYFHSVRKVLWKWLYSKSEKIITLTEKTKDEMKESLGFGEERFVVVPNPIIDDTIDVRCKEPVEEPMFASEQKVILGIGRLTRQKDFSTLIKAFAKVREKMDCCLMILGEGEEMDQLKHLCKELHVEKDVYLPGFVSNPFKYMANADLFVLSSLWEDAGHVLVEAAYTKIPIVSTRCPYGQEEFLEYGKAGELCELSDVDDMSACMEKVLSEAGSAKRTEMVERAHANAMKYHITLHGEALEKVLMEL